MAMQAVHRGAMDFLVKPAAPDVLIAAVEKAVKKSFEDLAADAGQADLAEKAATLTDRELEVARLVAEGLLNKQIGDKLGISLPTVKLHRGNAAKKLGVRSAVAMAKAWASSRSPAFARRFSGRPPFPQKVPGMWSR